MRIMCPPEYLEILCFFTLTILFRLWSKILPHTWTMFCV